MTWQVDYKFHFKGGGRNAGQVRLVEIRAHRLAVWWWPPSWRCFNPPIVSQAKPSAAVYTLAGFTAAGEPIATTVAEVEPPRMIPAGARVLAPVVKVGRVTISDCVTTVELPEGAQVELPGDLVEPRPLCPVCNTRDGSKGACIC